MLSVFAMLVGDSLRFSRDDDVDLRIAGLSCGPDFGSSIVPRSLHADCAFGTLQRLIGSLLVR